MPSKDLLCTHSNFSEHSLLASPLTRDQSSFIICAEPFTVLSSHRVDFVFRYVMDELGSALRHSDKANFRVTPFLYMPDGTLASAIRFSLSLCSMIICYNQFFILFLVLSFFRHHV